ncbi:3-hydroxyisobutyrate dehydrogenase [Desulfacinum infernum DSM 9756]|uniref:3-hydroxyisobutyrate dehydrogenase n=2 Tax=Desulfacinum infernum TaxID=35837 RepID=A0A1M4XTS8_9BACT|nr:3-hydroxyisobutyrate dehydrogenase [Desulfacinum infernum DSM 9756]
MTQAQTQNLKACDPQWTRIGWIGTGVMGAAMCAHLLKAGYSVAVHNRTREKAVPLLEQGARWVESPAEAAREAHVVLSMVGFPEDVWEVYLGKEGVLQTAREGTVVVDMTTTEPHLAQEIHKYAKTKGVYAVDAPVSGGDVGAREGTLSIMIGGDPEAVDVVLPLFRILGKNIVYQGPAGAGQHTKMCNQIVIAGTMIGVCESLLYGARAGLDLETMLQSISRGAAACWTLDNLAPRILKKNFDPGFFVEHFIKDMGIALKEAERMGLCLPGLALVHQLYLAVKAQGHGKKGTHALMLALEQLAGSRP